MDKINAKKFDRYVYEKRAIGLSDKQIATSLGMSLKHLNKMLSGSKPQEEKVVEKKPEPPKVKIPEIKSDPVISEPLNKEAPGETEVITE